MNNKVTHCIFVTFLIFILYGIFQHTFQVFFGIYCLARECRKIQTTSKKVHQRSLQALPPHDEFLTVSDLPGITLQQKSLLQPTEDTIHNTLVLVKDHASPEADLQKDYRPLAPTQIMEHTTNNSSQRNTPIHQVEPVLFTTTPENYQLQ